MNDILNQRRLGYHKHYISKSIGTPSNDRFDCFSNIHEYKS